MRLKDIFTMSFRKKLHHFFNIRGFVDPKILDYPVKNCGNPGNVLRDTWEDFFHVTLTKTRLTMNSSEIDFSAKKLCALLFINYDLYINCEIF